MSETKIVIVGAGYAGLLAAIRTKKNVGARAQVVLVNPVDLFVERIRQHQVAGADVLARHSIAEILDGTGVELVLGRVSAIEPAQRRVIVDGQPHTYDRLVLALGSRVDRDAVPGIAEHAFTLDERSAASLALALPSVARAGGRLLVCGGGLTGIESATELAERYPSLKVTLATAGRFGAGLSPKAARHLKRVFERLQIAVAENVRIAALTAEAALTDGAPLGFEICVWAGGLIAQPLAREAGLAVNERGQVLVDAMLRSISHPGIYAIGDQACVEGAPGSPLHMSCKIAMPMGAHGADNLSAWVLGKVEQPFDFRDTGICISLGRKDGIVQVRRADGTPANFAFTGRLGAWFKERVCRFTVAMLRAEHKRWWSYQWLHTKRPAALPAASSKPKRLAA
jgi:NADH dehydrogenase